MATPNTNIILKEFANGVRNVKDGHFFPFKSGVFIASTTAIPTKSNVRYYIKDIVISYSTLVTDAGTEISVAGIWNNAPITLADIIKTTLVVNIGSQEFHPGVLLDKETPVAVVAATITSVAVTISYAEVDDLG